MIKCSICGLEYSSPPTVSQMVDGSNAGVYSGNVRHAKNTSRSTIARAYSTAV